MSKIVILRGNSGSGKSTVSRALQRKIGRGSLLISQDYIRREMLWVQDRPDNKAIDLLINLVVFGYRNCDFTILEGILCADVYDRLFKQITTIFGNNIFAYYFDLPFEETLYRHKQKVNSHEFGEANMRRWWRDNDFLSDISEKMIHKDMDLDKIVEFVYQDII